MHWVAHGIGGLVGVVIGIWLLATCIHYSATPCADILNCHNCTNVLDQTPWSPEAAAIVGGPIGVAVVETYYLRDRSAE